MSEFKSVNPSDISKNTFDLIGKQWALVTAGDKDALNTMTVSWGGAGIMWGKPVAFTFIRPMRHTFSFLEKGDYFTMSFLPEEYREALKLCGSKSGKDCDKIAEAGLTTLFTDNGVPYFAEAEMVFVCKKMYGQFLNEESVTGGEDVLKWYNEDYHKMYISEICEVLVK